MRKKKFRASDKHSDRVVYFDLSDIEPCGDVESDIAHLSLDLGDDDMAHFTNFNHFAERWYLEYLHNGEWFKLCS